MKGEITPAEPTKGTQTVVMLDSSIEEMEERIVPGNNLNHNETLVRDEEEPKGQSPAAQFGMKIEELEEKIAPGSNLNHNQTFVRDEIDSGGD